ncbi:type 4a pilus biogenesis protein PilO [Couchioplanes azureus]|uniref:type 4a pilus biogenesis protein PilO n=1 Tax=Couchioplanes caeruleus TaxID=56438 RepID=UPI00166FCABF|nr:type 4a pilus biogenesis protein PilO [Couchioplanes caeruleus]GGQ64556.1 hypothetical protein GCM10010166_37680 [Couchioplanes caeruleus subsp. azureus]
MRTGHADRLWLILGFLAAGLLVAVTYFVVVSTTSADTQELADQTATAETQRIKLLKEITELEKTKKIEKKLKATRDAYRKALPSTSGIPAFLRQLQTQGGDVGVDVNGLTVGAPEEIEGAEGVWSIKIQLAAEGSAEELGDFLNQLQGSSQKRAVLIESATYSAASDSEGEGGTAAKSQLDLSVQAFVAPPVGSGAPSVTTD